MAKIRHTGAKFRTFRADVRCLSAADPRETATWRTSARPGIFGSATARSSGSATARCSWPARACRVAPGPRHGAGGAARGGGERRRPYRHQRLLRPAGHEPDHPRGAGTLSGRSDHRHHRREARHYGSWNPAFSAENLTATDHDNLRNLGVETLAVVNLRAMFGTYGPAEGSIAAPLEVLAGLQRQDLFHHIEQRHRAANRRLRRYCRDYLRAEPVQPRPPRRGAGRRTGGGGHCLCAVLPAWRLLAAAVGGARRDCGGLGATPLQVALAWLLRRSPNILIIPGTSSVGHLRENLAAAELDLSQEAMTKLEAVGAND